MPEPLPKPRACIFDLDGTLVDSLQDIAESLNHCLELLGLPTYPVTRYRHMAGEGVPKLCQRAVGETHPHLVQRLAELARPLYRTRATRHTRPYPGVSELVERLRAARIRLGVLSNKPHDLTVRIVRTFWSDNTFQVVYGYLEEQRRKPSPYYLRRICERLAVAPAETWMVGDTPTDLETAHAAGAVAIGAAWGFRPRADLVAARARWVVDYPEELY
ncbi:MAG: HAD family hydrolase [Phycisphaerae bacterium]|nr:HAD family hydrolase [Phycisphaerae bacterium]